MAKLEEVETALKTLSNFLQPALPFINSHLNSFFTNSYWEKHLPKNLQEDLSAVTVSELKNYFNQLACIKRTSSGGTLNTPVQPNVSFADSNLEDIINRIGQLFLCSLNLSCGVDQFDSTSSAASDLGENGESRPLNATELCETVSNTSYVGWSSCKFDPFMSPKKMHEVEIMSEFVLKVANFQNDSYVAVSSPKSGDDLPLNCHTSSRLCQPFGVEYLIDLGSGKGYLSSFLVLLYNYKVLAIDSSSVNTYGCTKRTATLQKNWSSIIRRAQERQTQRSGTTKRGKHWKSRNLDASMHNLHVSYPITTTSHESNTGAIIGNTELPDNTLNSVSVPSSEVESETSEDLKSVTLYVMDDLNLLHLLQENFFIRSVNSESSISYGLVGLHTCGTLGVDSIKLFCNSEQAKFLVNVPCCYHLLNEQYEEDDTAVAGDTNKAFGFPLCKNLQRIQFCVGRNARMMSAQSVHRMSSDDGNLDISRPLLFRALLSVIIKEKLGHTALKTHVGRIGGKFSNFQQYVRKALAKLQLKDLKVSDDDIDEVYRSHEQSIERFHKYFLLRALFAPLIETCILLDRLAYLLEQKNVREAYIVELFDPFLSPRCHAVVALR